MSSEKSEHVCKPLNTLEEVLPYSTIPLKNKTCSLLIKKSVSYINTINDCHSEGNALNIRKRILTKHAPKTLVCHDMKGGYLQDKYIYGCAIGNGYTFTHWDKIDIFVYFSHHLVTIPPPGWVKLAHRYEVRILGTVITEFTDGAKICKKIFESEESWMKFADALVNISIINAFDGWLLNFENEIDDPEALLKFVKYLHEKLHSLNPGYLLIWYDSVTSEGKLKWQNELNELNKCYFDACDGIFLNYTWKKENLEKSVEAAGDRILDVFVGMDVFGRNFYEGGGFKCNLAAKIIRDCGLSMAIFAQGWTHETLRPNTLDNFHEVFLYRDNAFWLKLYPYLYTRPISKSFLTTFYTGSDKHNYYLDTQEKNLSILTHCGPTYFTDFCCGVCDCIQLHSEGYEPHRLSYLITTAGFNNKQHVHRLFTCNIWIKYKVTVEIVTKELKEVNRLLVVCLMEDRAGKYINYVLTEFTVPREFREEFSSVPKNWVLQRFVHRVTDAMKLVDVGIILQGKEMLLGGFALMCK